MQKLLSQRGIASRRQAEKLILGGRVTVNGEIAEVGQQADVSVDRICVDGVEIGESFRRTYFLIHKPKGVVSTCHDPQGRKTVLDLLDADFQQGAGIHP
ncbi:MAG: S4 domain-containing protein, partial [Phormidesmis sp.]